MSSLPSKIHSLLRVIASAVMRLTQRVEAIAESATVRVARLAKKLQAEGRDVLDLSVGEPDFPSPAAAVAAAQRALRDGHTKYTENPGTADLRRGLAEDYHRRFGATWTENQVIVTAGAKMALFELSQALFEAGDEVVLPSPCWVSFAAQIRLAGADPVFVETCVEDAFRIHPQPLLDAVTERTRAVLINAPGNPTGGVISLEDLRRLAEECAARGIALICDETYERIVYDGPVVSAAALMADFPETVVVVGSFSKTYAMTGWRLGYAFGPEAVIRALARVQSHSTSNPTSFAMAGAVAALAEGEGFVASCLAEYAERRRLLQPLLEALPGVRCRPPAGAFYAFPEVDAARGVDAGGEGSVALAERLLERARVAVVPGVAFGREGHLRISFACDPERLRRGIERIGEELAKS